MGVGNGEWGMGMGNGEWRVENGDVLVIANFHNEHKAPTCKCVLHRCTQQTCFSNMYVHYNSFISLVSASQTVFIKSLDECRALQG